MKQFIRWLNSYNSWPGYWEAKAKCFVFGHTTGNHHRFMCSRCGLSDSEIRNRPATIPDRWRLFKRRFAKARHAEGGLPGYMRSTFGRWFANGTGYVPGSNPREDRQRSTWRNYFITVFGRRVGFQYAPLFINDRPYMTRYIVYLGPINLRVHQFFRGDDDRAPHNHPWWFITFPFSTYVEAGFEKGVYKGVRFVKRWRFHYRPATFEHIVLGPAAVLGGKAITYRGAPFVDTSGKPFWTFVIAGSKAGDWGFYPQPGVFVPWWEFKP